MITGLMRIRDISDDKRITNSSIIQFDSYHNDVNFDDEASQFMLFTKAVCSNELYEAIKNAFINE